MVALTAAFSSTLPCANDNESFLSFLMDIRGQAAALGGLPLRANPYGDDTFEAACWSAGWTACTRALMVVPAPPPKAAFRLREVR